MTIRPTRYCRFLAISVLFLGGALVGQAAIKVQVDHDPEFDFSTLRTWTWHPDGPGDVKMAVTKDDDPEAVQREFEPRLLPVVEAELAKRGFQRAAGEPDFYVTYYALVTAGSSDQYVGQFFPGPMWGIPILPPATSSLKVFPRGSLILDITSRVTGEVVWRGVAQAELKWGESRAKRDQRVREAVQELLKQLPPKRKK